VQVSYKLAQLVLMRVNFGTYTAVQVSTRWYPKCGEIINGSIISNYQSHCSDFQTTTVSDSGNNSTEFSDNSLTTFRVILLMDRLHYRQTDKTNYEGTTPSVS